MNKNKIISLILLFVLIVSAVTLSGCSVLKDIILSMPQHQTVGGMEFSTHAQEDGTPVAYVHVVEDTDLGNGYVECEIPAYIEYEGVSYKVTKVYPIDGHELTGPGTPSLAASDGNVASIIIPETVEEINLGYRRGLSYLQSITVHPDNNAYKSIDGVMYTKDGTRLIKYPSGKQNTTFQIPKETLEIGLVLRQNIYIQDITVEEGSPFFTSIDGVLYSLDKTELVCYPLAKKGKHFVVPNTVKIIRAYAIYPVWIDSKMMIVYNMDLETVYIPESVETIEQEGIVDMDVYCESLSIPSSYDLQGLGGLVQSGVSYDEYLKIISAWEDNTNDNAS